MGSVLILQYLRVLEARLWQTADSSWEFLKIENDQITTLFNYYCLFMEVKNS